MDDKFKKWLCELAGCPAMRDNYLANELEILIKAVWKINREREYFICIMSTEIMTGHPYKIDGEYFKYKDYKNETEALTAALKYIFDNKE